MRSAFFILAFFLSWYGGVARGVELKDLHWEPIRLEEGIQLYTAEHPDSDYIAVRADLTVNATIGTVIRNAHAVDEYPLWFENCIKSDVLSKDGDEIIYYMILDLPWPVSDRDAVIKLLLKRINQKTLYLTQSITKSHNISPVPGAIRVKKAKVEMIVTALSEERIKIIAMNHNEPGGWIPVWIVNWFVDDTVYKSAVNSIKRLEELHKNKEK
jgi:hypothetical protein